MSEPAGSEESPRQALERAVKDLWSMVQEEGDNFVVFTDRRRLGTRVERTCEGVYRVSWEHDDGTWEKYAREFENPREAAFHAYQGPH